MKHTDKNEVFFKNLASSYAEKSGNEAKKELQYFQAADVTLLDKKTKSKIRAYKVKTWTSRLMPVAACLIIFITYIIIARLPLFNLSGSYNSADDTPTEYSDSAAVQSDDETYNKTLTFEFVSAKLPSEYTLRKVDYDYHKAIYYIINSEGNEIILSIEEYTGDINTDGLNQMKIKNLTAYGVSTEDYNFLQYKKNNFLYTLTNLNDYDELIEISESLI